MTLEGTWPRGKKSKMTRNYTRSPRTTKKERDKRGRHRGTERANEGGRPDYSNNRRSRGGKAKPALCPPFFLGNERTNERMNQRANEHDRELPAKYELASGTAVNCARDCIARMRNCNTNRNANREGIILNVLQKQKLPWRIMLPQQGDRRMD